MSRGIDKKKMIGSSLTATLLAIALAITANKAFARAVGPPAPDLARGAAIAAQACAACHSIDGDGAGGTYPKLAGQHAKYLYKQLEDYKPQPGATAAARNNPVMAGFAAALSDADMHHVSAYFAAQEAKPGFAKNPATVALGERIYRGGGAGKGVPACASCHSPTGAGIPTQYPRLAGQWAEYTSVQLIAFRDGVRQNNAPMQTIAVRLSDQEIKAVADYIAGLR